jgi:rod shape-determining protein MreD
MIYKNAIRFLVLIFLQVLILNHISLSGYINPYLYVYFILLLPFETPYWLLLTSAFAIGIGVDVFSNTIGLNAAASVAMAFSRPMIIRSVSSGIGPDYTGTPSIVNQGMKWFFYYAAFLILIHHTVLFYLEVFSFHEFFATLLRVLLSSAFTLALVFVAEYLGFRRK